ncbi:MAG: diadenylate cyclase CdaA [Spirochaetaceae bacterium]|nr:diadenylate cyclase CdaA [Spirochaetaceae bacterium]
MNGFDILENIYGYIRPLLDIGVLAFLFYKVYTMLIKTNGIQLIKAAVFFAIAYSLAWFLQLSVLLWLLNLLVPSLIISFAIVFQPEIRKIFLKLGQTNWFSFRNRSKHSHIDSVLIAAETLSSQRRGMLAVFVRNTELKDIIETGQKLNADLSSSLLVTIFAHDTPLHDGAVVIQGGTVLAAGCFLPLSEQYDIKKTFGTRHRAALGMSESSDAIVLVVSEETGSISLAYDSRLHYDLTLEQLNEILGKQLVVAQDSLTQEDTSDEN